ncbi:DUF421 domain-containing protein [Alcaligenaceae bacterium]|nr:DUF421 domain-containing protein [Alcaligenaceae bacterium]
MLELQVVWWELIMRALIIYVALFVMIRVTGKRAVGQFSPFDLIVVLLLAQAVSGSLTGGDESLPGGLIIALALLTLNVLMDFITSYSSKAGRLLEGREVLLGRNGRIFEDALKENLITRGALEAALRHADVPLEEMGAAILEADGKISVLRNR